MNNQNNLKNKSERNSKKLRSFGAICESIHAKLARNPGTRNFVGFAAVVVLICVVWSFAQQNEQETLGHTVMHIATHKAKEMGLPGNAKNHAIIEGGRSTLDIVREIKPTEKEWNGTYMLRGPNSSGKWENSEEKETKLGLVLVRIKAWRNNKQIEKLIAIPKEAFSEYGAVPKENVKQMILLADYGERGEPLTAPKLQVRVLKPGERQDLQGSTPELIAAMNATLPRPDRIPNGDYLSTWNTVVAGAKGLFETFAEYQVEEKALTDSEKTKRDKDLWKFSLRPEFDQRQVAIKGSPDDRPDLSCGVRAMQDALELLWSRKEGRPVKISAAYIRWAHDQKLGGARTIGTSYNRQIEGIWKYGACEEKYMSENQRTPSAAALADGAKRKTLVVRRIGIAKRIKINEGDGPNNVFSAIVPSLMISELRKGHPILVVGPALMPGSKNRSSPILSLTDSQSMAEWKKGSTDPKSLAGPYWEGNSKRLGSHSHLLTGYYAYLAPESGTAPPFLTDLPGGRHDFMFEFRESMSTNLGDKGYVYTPAYRIWDLNDKYVSLGLE